jgi:hypothetical protein
MPDESPTTQQPPIRFASDIKPLFRERDRTAMRRAFDLRSHDDVVAHGQAILGRLKAGTMPCDGAWPANQVAMFEHWLAQAGSE